MFGHRVRIYKTEQPKPEAIPETKNKLNFYPTKKLLPTGFAENLSRAKRSGENKSKSHYPFPVMGFFVCTGFRLFS